MRIATKNGWYVGGRLISRREPWTDSVEVDDDLWDKMPDLDQIRVTQPPAGWKFKDGVSAEDFPTKGDCVPDEAANVKAEPTKEEVSAAKKRLAAAKK